MKVLAIALLAVAAFSVNAADDVDVAGDVRRVIGEILDQIAEPLVDIHDVSYSVDLLVEKIDIDVVDVEVKGIKNLDIQQLDYDASSGRLDYDLTFTDIEADVDIDIILSGLIDLDHHPTIKVELDDLKLAGYTVVDTDIEPNQLTDFKLLVTLGGTQIELTNLLNDDELTQTLLDVLNKNLPSIVDNIALDLEPVVSPIVQSAINIILRNVES